MSDRDDWYPDGPPPGGDPTAPLPPIGADRDPEPTWIMGPGEATPPHGVVPPPPVPGDPTRVMPGVGAAGPPPPVYGGAGGGGGYGGGPGGPDDGEPEWDGEPVPWYRQPGPLAALIAGLAALILGLIALVVLTSDGDDTSDDTLPPPATTASTLPPTSSAAPTTQPAAPTTEAPTTTAAPTTTTTTVPETTTTTTTTVPETTTTVPPTTAPPPPTTVPVVTVPPGPGATSWDIITNSPDLSRFREAIEAAGLVDVVNGDQLITVLAPSNDAFELAESGVGGGLPTDPDELRALMGRHIITADLSEDALLALDEVETLDGDVLDIGDNRIEDATIIVPDVQSANGYIQVIDRVLLPGG